MSNSPKNSPSGSWVVVYLAPNLALAEMVKQMLTNEGILVMLRSIGPPHLGPSGPVEVMVPRVEAKDAVQVLDEALHGS